MGTPQFLFAQWPRLRRKLRAKQRVLLTDFDGTLSPIARNPSGAKLSPRVKQSLLRIARRDPLGVITGRTLRDIRGRIGIRGIWYAGSHGYEICSPGGTKILRLSAREKQLVAKVTRAVKRGLTGLPRLVIEAKPAMIAIHYRRASRDVRKKARSVVQRVASRNPGVEMLHGKKVWDLAPRRPSHRAGKWSAVDYILKKVTQATKRPAFLAYVGDDTTDEQVFRHMRGLSIVVGRRKKTAARYFLRSPGDVAQFLREWERL